MRDLGTLGGSTSVALAISDHGRVVGTSATAGGEPHAFVWADGRMRDLGLAAFATANDLNDRGQVTGGVPVGEAYHAYRLQRGQLTDLDAADVPWSEGVAINEAGQVAGFATTPDELPLAFRWDHGRMANLGTLGGLVGIGLGLDDRGRVVGRMVVDHDHLRGAAGPLRPDASQGALQQSHPVVGGDHDRDWQGGLRVPLHLRALYRAVGGRIQPAYRFHPGEPDRGGLSSRADHRRRAGAASEMHERPEGPDVA
jgi:probable HAF family extracellular repeat protein